MIVIIVLVVVVLLVIWCVSIYNNLVKLRNNRENAFANIDVQLKQRHDLVPQLVASVKGYADHEKEVFQRVTEARLQLWVRHQLMIRCRRKTLLLVLLPG